MSRVQEVKDYIAKGRIIRTLSDSDNARIILYIEYLGPKLLTFSNAGISLVSLIPNIDILKFAESKGLNVITWIDPNNNLFLMDHFISNMDDEIIEPRLDQLLSYVNMVKYLMLKRCEFTPFVIWNLVSVIYKNEISDAPQILRNSLNEILDYIMDNIDEVAEGDIPEEHILSIYDKIEPEHLQRLYNSLDFVNPEIEQYLLQTVKPKFISMRGKNFAHDTIIKFK